MSYACVPGLCPITIAALLRSKGYTVQEVTVGSASPHLHVLNQCHQNIINLAKTTKNRETKLTILNLVNDI